METLLNQSATSLLAMIKNKNLKIIELAHAYVRQIEDINPKINALIQFDKEQFLTNADHADNLLNRNTKVGRLHGLPISFKDALHVKDFRISKAFPGFLNEPSITDATVVTRLKNEGAIPLGITNVPELLLGYETDNSIYGRTNNPHDLSRTPGGSSGGEAALIAAHASVVGIGTDAGGSLRIPAHFCGISAHKPTKGLVPFTGNIPFDGATGLTTQRVTMGPMARCVDDLILMMSIISGSDEQDPYVPQHAQFMETSNHSVQQLRIGYFFDLGDIFPCEDTVKTLNNVIAFLKSKNISIEECNSNFAAKIYREHWETLTITVDKGERIRRLYEQYGAEMPGLVKSFLNDSASHDISLSELHQRYIEIEIFRIKMQQIMNKYDALIIPVAATTAKKHNETFSAIREFSYTFIASLSGYPATVIPCGRDKNNLPIGVQIIGRPWRDYECLMIAKEIENHFGVV